jgi:hypothetical protein
MTLLLQFGFTFAQNIKFRKQVCHKYGHTTAVFNLTHFLQFEIYCYC